MRAYELLDINYGEYKYLVISTSLETPLTHLNDIAAQFSCQTNDFKVVFDLLLSMGNNSERFIEAQYDGDTKHIGFFNVVKVDKKNTLRKITSEYYKDNACFLENSVLNSQQKKLLSKGVPI